MARLDQALTTAMERYLADVHSGRVDPQKIHHNFSPPEREPFDAAAHLQSALADGRLGDAALETAPRLPVYASLREALAAYHARTGHAAWREPLPPLPAPRYDEPLVGAVKAFQRRHGLGVDGVLGKATLAALQVMPAARARQIELALARLRWTPLMQGPRMVVVNIPEFVLRACEVQDGRPFFLDDLCGLDRLLDAALRQHSQTLPTLYADAPSPKGGKEQTGDAEWLFLHKVGFSRTTSMYKQLLIA